MKAVLSLLLSFVFFQFSSCKGEKLEVEGFWKYSEGFYIGDVLDFKVKHLEIRKDTVFRNNRPVAQIQKIENNFFVKRLYIKSINSNVTGVYVEK